MYIALTAQYRLSNNKIQANVTVSIVQSYN